MAQSLLIGLGGTGSRVVNNTIKLLKQNGLSFNNGEICCAVLDTNVNDAGEIRSSGTEVPVFETSKPQRIRDYLEQIAERAGGDYRRIIGILTRMQAETELSNPPVEQGSGIRRDTTERQNR